ncbi:MAG TPA: DegT/DnrJ/EryC1/StrS family aminotransferase [Armatimonadetes bacterium]|jgi:dTDP-4-amino-4,6-dideoxygalactose transaminase|nr:DegT/DnrJ/EryC1/StrS family aminotransferase [Armatimonadota bacterium]
MSKLAIHGGEKAITRLLARPWPERDEREEQALAEVVQSGIWWRGGYANAADSQVGRFEDAFARFHDAKYCVAVTNGTQAIECALKAAGIEAGDEVLVPALTFVASATAIALVNAVPVFVDVDAGTYNIDPDALEAAITEKTRAAVIVHNGGYPCDMDRILEIAKRRGIAIIEDCAHAHGSQWKGIGVGALGALGTFSFQMGKTLTCGEGGAVLTNDPELAEKAYSFHHIGRLSGRPFYEFHRVASNLRMTEFQGAILLSQLSRLEEQTARRERNATYLAKGLKEIPGIDPIERDPRVTRWGFYYLNLCYRQDEFDGVPRDRFLQAIQAEGVPMAVGAHGQPIYRNPLFQSMNFGRTGCPVRCPLYGKPVDYTQTVCPTAERLYATQALSLPHALFLGETTEEMDLILDAIRKVRAHADELKS